MGRPPPWLCLTAVLAILSPGPPTSFGVSLLSSASPVNASVLKGTSDYSGATWVPADPANYSPAERPHDYPVQMIVIHDTEESAGAAIQKFQDPTSAVSAHYVVSQTGRITQMVAEQDIAWHAGNWDYNTRAIGIEHEGYAGIPGTYTSAEYRSALDGACRLTGST
jgi:hypothetical protein